MVRAGRKPGACQPCWKGNVLAVNLVSTLAPPFLPCSAASCSPLRKPHTQAHISLRVLLHCLASAPGSPLPPSTLSSPVEQGSHPDFGAVVGAPVFFSPNRHTGISHLRFCIRACRRLSSSRKDYSTHCYFLESDLPFWPKCLTDREFHPVPE